MERRRTSRELPPPLASAALDALDTMLVITDRGGVVVYVNPAFTRVTGYRYDEAVGSTPALLSSGLQDENFYRRLWERILEGHAWSGELVNRKKDGSLYTDRMTITPLRDPAGRITHFVAVKRDVSGHLADLTAGNPGGIAHTDHAGRLVYANDRLASLLGRPFEDLLGRGWLDALGEEAGARVERELRLLDDGSELVSVLDLPDGRGLRVHYAPLLLGLDTPAGVIAVLTDVTADREAVREITEREAYARGILESLGTPTVVVDGAGVIRDVNRSWRDRARETGATPGTTGVGTDYGAVCLRSAEAGCDQAGLVVGALDRVLAGESELETLDYRVDGPTVSWWELRISPLAVRGGGAVLTHLDVTLRYEVQALLEAQARTDPLTGLANRTGLLHDGEGAMARARRSQRPVTVLFIDLDRFKPINDRHGHGAGDEVLKVCAQRLRGLVRETDGVARVGGDEFVLVCEDLDEAEVPLLEARLARALSAPIDVGATVRVGASIGTVRAPGSADLARIVADADARMYAAKRTRSPGD